jgi:putative endonuclease
MVRMQNQYLYTGVSVDVDKRLRKHCAGNGARYLRAKQNLQLVYKSNCRMSHTQALSLERQIKRLPKSKKELIIQLQPIDPRSVVCA